MHFAINTGDFGATVIDDGGVVIKASGAFFEHRSD